MGYTNMVSFLYFTYLASYVSGLTNFKYPSSIKPLDVTPNLQHCFYNFKKRSGGFGLPIGVKLEQPIHKWVYEDIRSFLKTRYKPLAEEIDAAQSPDTIAFVAFIWHETGDVELKSFNVPDHLNEKLTNCISYEDMDYIMEMVGQKIDKKSKGN